MRDNHYDLVVIGGGPGGYTAAARAANLGMNTALVERRNLGGTCLNQGCIPTAAMLHSAGLHRQFRRGEQFGICAENVRLDYGKMLAYREETVQILVRGVEQTLARNGVALFSGIGTLLPNKRVKVMSAGGETILAAENILLATGSKARVPDIPGAELPGVVDSDGALAWNALPESITIIGGGVIGVEYAQIFSDFGSRVTLLGTRARLLPGMDREISQSLKMLLRKRGVDVRTDVSVSRIEKADEQLNCIFTEKDRPDTALSQRVLYAVGRTPCFDGLFSGEIPFRVESGHIAVDSQYKTSIPGVYAVGDVIGGIQLAHNAMAQGTLAVEGMAGASPSVDGSTVPSCVYTDPEIASVGLTEAEAKGRGFSVRVGKCVMGGNGRSVVTREERGFMKVIASADTGAIVGAQLMCAGAGEMIGEFASAISNGFTVTQLLRAVRPHPTYNEALIDALRQI